MDLYWRWGGSGNAVGQFNAPFGIAWIAPHRLVVDQLNKPRAAVFSRMEL